MCCNYRLSQLKKRDLILINFKRKDELDDICFLGNIFGKELYNFGDIFTENDICIINEKSLDFFFDADMQKHFKENNPKILTKEALSIIINLYKNKIISEYEENLNKIKIKEDCLIEYFDNKIKDWSSNLIIDIENKKKNLVNSGYCEYDIFELIYVYKTFDFENNYLVFHKR